MTHPDSIPCSPYRIGTSGWNYPDWKGPFYPPRRMHSSDLQFYARHFQHVEVNATFYRMFKTETAQNWCRQTRAIRDDFSFSVKCWQGLTHERGASIDRHTVQQIRDFCSVFTENEQYAGLLIQFPYSFHPAPSNRRYLAELLDLFSDQSPIVEIRSDDWIQEKGFFQLLRDTNASYCNIDQPPLAKCPEPLSIVTAPLACLRLHGRNSEGWFSDSADRNDRYNYLYGPDEIIEIAGLARSLANQAQRVLIVANNHYRAQAVADALLLRHHLEGQADTAPASLIKTYSHLKQIHFRETLSQDRFIQTDMFE